MSMVSCNILNSDTESSECGPGIIIPGECIEGVKLGDSREQVEKLLGEPWNIGWTDGPYRAWRTYVYRPSENPTSGHGLSISFIYYSEDQPWGAVDMIRIYNSNGSKTPEGIGIGSTLDEVLSAYDEPDFVREGFNGDGGKQGSYLWCHGITKFTIGTLNDTVEGFFMGNHIPFSDEEEQDYRCID
ncbi:MAG TPA: hypothetical protein DCE78_10035 [Bacteroidetes bacterium]|nr:hypothetical protein [Bacteroidota bacterium]